MFARPIEKHRTVIACRVRVPSRLAGTRSIKAASPAFVRAMSVRQAATREHIGGNLDRHRWIANFVRHQSRSGVGLPLMSSASW